MPGFSFPPFCPPKCESVSGVANQYDVTRSNATPSWKCKFWVCKLEVKKRRICFCNFIFGSVVYSWLENYLVIARLICSVAMNITRTEYRVLCWHNLKLVFAWLSQLKSKWLQDHEQVRGKHLCICKEEWAKKLAMKMCCLLNTWMRSRGLPLFEKKGI